MRILVAMSGGVDSSVAAALLRDEGHDVIGATLKLWGGVSDSGCCSVADVDDARRVAQILGLDHHVFNYTEEFERDVVDPFVAAHARGEAPNPCIECNRHIKFDLLMDRAERLGFDAVATGHHARVIRRDGEAVLARGVDAHKDQSYVLGYLSRRQLARLVLPIGEMDKDEVRAHARRLGLRTWDKPDSQDVCFIEASKGRAAFLGDRLDLTPASIVERASGEVIGTTPAAQLVTVGQRRGITPGPDGERRFVASIDVARGRVEVGTANQVAVTRLSLEPTSVTFARDEPEATTAVFAQWSAHGEPRRARLVREGAWRLDLVEPARPVAPGQSVVWYRGDDPDVVEGAAVVARP